MPEKRFFEYSTPSLRAVHAFNSMIMTIHRQFMGYVPSYDRERVRYAPKDVRQQVVNLLAVRKNYDDVTKFVPGSAKYQQVHERIEAYNKARVELDGLKYESLVICDEIHPDYFKLVQHQVTIIETGYDEHDDLDEYDIPTVYTFLTHQKGFMDELTIVAPEEIQDLCLPYVTYKDGGKRDLIQQELDNISHLNRRIRSMELAEKLEIKHWELAALLPLEQLTHKSDALGLHKFVEYKGYDYSESELSYLHKQWLDAKTKKWVMDDQYMDYPTWGTYVQFLERVKAGEISPA